MINLIYILLAILGLGFLVFIHELGHYFVARRNNMKIEVFSIGFGKPIFSWMRGTVRWQICWCLFGGYVRIAGMEKDGDKEPYDIEGGFFNKGPWVRIKVALAGPITNLVFAFLAFAVIWGMGGRDKSLSELTPTIGWIDPSSELYEKGLRAGDKIKSYNGYDYKSNKDHVYAAMLSGNDVAVEGWHISSEDGSSTTFQYNITPYPHPDALEKGFLTTGIMSPASYLIYNPPTDTEHQSGLKPGDRIIWADGEMIYSPYQLAQIVNNNKALLTIERQDELFLTAINKAEILKSKPFINSENRVLKGFSSLNKNDIIIAVDGNSVENESTLFKALQKKYINIIAEHASYDKQIVMGQEESAFNYGIDYKALNTISTSIGQKNSIINQGNLYLLKKIEPLPRVATLKDSNLLSQWDIELQKQRENALEIKDSVKRARALKLLLWQENQLFLGFNNLSDLIVTYNPQPVALFGELTHETLRTLKALVSGNLNPKWLGGPIGIMQIMHHGWSLGIREALFWIAFISMNLGVLNLMPIPALDGGYIVLSIYELITRHRIKAKTMERLVLPFAIVLIGFFVFLSYQDIVRLIQSLWN